MLLTPMGMIYSESHRQSMAEQQINSGLGEKCTSKLYFHRKPCLKRKKKVLFFTDNVDFSILTKQRILCFHKYSNIQFKCTYWLRKELVKLERAQVIVKY